MPTRVAGTPQWATPSKAIGKLSSGNGFQNHDCKSQMRTNLLFGEFLDAIFAPGADDDGVGEWLPGIEFWSTEHKRWVPHQPKPDRGMEPPSKT